MRVIVLTGSLRGTASALLPVLAAASGVEVARVVYSEGGLVNPQRHRRRKLDKVRQIGLLGALNGLRMRRWYKEDAYSLLGVEPLDALASRLGLPFDRTAVLNSDETARLFEEAGADLGLSLGNGYIAKRIFTIPKHGMLNIHHEILPDFRGAQSVLWQLYEGSAETGYTIHRINERIDAGEILYRERLPIDFHSTLAETVSHTYAKLIARSGHGLVEVLTNFHQYLADSAPQQGGRSYTTPSLRAYLRILRNHRRLRAASGR